MELRSDRYAMAAIPGATIASEAGTRVMHNRRMKGFDLRGKAALVTGGNGGIGLGMAKGLAQAGADLAIAGRDEAKNASALRELKEIGVTAIAVKADLKDEKA